MFDQQSLHVLNLTTRKCYRKPNSMRSHQEEENEEAELMTMTMMVLVVGLQLYGERHERRERSVVTVSEFHMTRSRVHQKGEVRSINDCF